MGGWGEQEEGCYGINGTQAGKNRRAGVTLDPDQISKCHILGEIRDRSNIKKLHFLEILDLEISKSYIFGEK